MPIPERVMSIVQIRSAPRDIQPLEPGDPELGFKAFPKASLGLGIEMDASSDLHR